MQWSVEFEIVAFILVILLLLNLKSLRILPMKSGRLFVNLLFISLLIIVLDMSATEMDVHIKGQYIGLQIFLNTIYFAMIGLFFYSMRLFLSALAYEKRSSYYRRSAVSVICFFIVIACLIINLFNGMIFTVDTSGYSRGWGYYYLVFPYMMIELIIGLSYVIRARHFMPRRTSYSVYVSSACITASSAYQTYVEPGRLLMNVGIQVAMIIMYLAFIDIDNDNEIKTGTYNAKGFRRFMTERLLSHDHFMAYFLQIYPYNSLLAVFGRVRTDRLLWSIGRDLIKKHRATFYLHSGLFAVVETSENKYGRTLDDIIGVTETERYVDGEKVDLVYRTETVNDSCGFSDSAEMCNVVCDSIRSSGYDKGRFELISPEDVKSSYDKKQMNRILYMALKNGGVRVYYQPIYDNVTNGIHSAEALARIYDEEKGLIFPDNFIPLFEKDGTILKFGRIIFENVCRFIRDNDMEALGLEYIEVNLSPIQCMQPSLADDLIQIADNYGVDLKYINFEITETASLSADRLMHLMTKLIDRGATFSVDDFGTGYSNIIRVANLPFRIIKIDKSILWDYFKTKDEMVPRIYDMMHCKGFAMVTEGVETEDMHHWLKDEAKCQYEQGYLYSKPIDEQSFIEFLKKHNNKATA